MPFTFAHPAAVIPFKNYCPRFLNMPALIAGSLAPDLGYFLHNWHWSVAGHSFLGSLSFDLPAGLLLTALFYLNVRSLARLLPYPHREALSAICLSLQMPGFASLLILSVSVLLGAWTHIVWDGFTHANGWCVRQLSAYTPALFSLGTYKITIWHILQHGSTIFGLCFIFAAYRNYVYSKRFLKLKSMLGPKLRAALWLLVLMPPALYSFSKNSQIVSHGLSLAKFDDFSYKFTVSYICLFLPLLLAAGIVASLFEYSCQIVSALRSKYGSKDRIELLPDPDAQKKQAALKELEFESTAMASTVAPAESVQPTARATAQRT